MTNFSIVCAMTKSRVIGNNNTLPWRISEELKYFKSLTMGKPIIMGRNTFESLGRKVLPGRTSIVITSHPEELAQADNLVVVNSIAAAKQVVANKMEAMVVGGAKVYASFLPLASKLYLSVINKDYAGDAFFPEFDHSQWHKVKETVFLEFVAEEWERTDACRTV